MTTDMSWTVLSALPFAIFLIGGARSSENGHEAGHLASVRGGVRCLTGEGGSREAHVLNRYAGARGRPLRAAAARDGDEGDVAVLEDRGDLLVRRNPFDLDGRAVRLSPNGAGGFDAVPMARPIPPAGVPVTLDASGAGAVELPFAFPFFGARHTTAVVHGDGRVTFARPERPGDRSLAAFLEGPPAVAAFFTDLEPDRGGSVSVRTSAASVELLWTDVPGAGQLNRNTFAILLHADGTVDLVWGAMQTREAVAGVTPGGRPGLAAADLSQGEPAGTGAALVERFSETEEVDLVAVSRRFFAAYPDAFDQLVIYTTRPLNPVSGTLAFEINVRNDVIGIGVPILDDSASWGSAGVLESVVFMDAIDTYLEVDGLEVLAHEVGHRWLARLRHLTPAGGPSTALMGDGVHWSFFHDTPSFLGGNVIADGGGGRFETVDFARRYGPLDQYAMGLLGPEEVPPVFHVGAADDFRPARAYKPSSASEAGVAFTGVRHDVDIAQVVAAMGPRLPPAGEAPRRWTIAFILVAEPMAPATPRRRAAAARIRAAFGPFFEAATEGRMRAETRLLAR